MGLGAHPAGLETPLVLLGAQHSLAPSSMDGTLTTTGKAGKGKP